VNEQFEHDWQTVPIRRGKYAGEPMKQRQCPKCGIWETELSRSSWCKDGKAIFGEQKLW
jgi:hypothetical protein